MLIEAKITILSAFWRSGEHMELEDWVNRNRKFLNRAFLAALLGMLLFPPWRYELKAMGREISQPGRFAFVLIPPSKENAAADGWRYGILNVNLDWSRLILQLAILGIVAGVLLNPWRRRTHITNNPLDDMRGPLPKKAHERTDPGTDKHQIEGVPGPRSGDRAESHSPRDPKPSTWPPEAECERKEEEQKKQVWNISPSVQQAGSELIIALVESGYSNFKDMALEAKDYLTTPDERRAFEVAYDAYRSFDDNLPDRGVETIDSHATAAETEPDKNISSPSMMHKTTEEFIQNRRAYAAKLREWNPESTTAARLEAQANRLEAGLQKPEDPNADSTAVPNTEQPSSGGSKAERPLPEWKQKRREWAKGLHQQAEEGHQEWLAKHKKPSPDQK